MAWNAVLFGVAVRILLLSRLMRMRFLGQYMHDLNILRSSGPHLQHGGCMIIKQQSTSIRPMCYMYIYIYEKARHDNIAAAPTARIMYDRRLESL